MTAEFQGVQCIAAMRSIEIPDASLRAGAKQVAKKSRSSMKDVSQESERGKNRTDLLPLEKFPLSQI
jgi:hypothetical protein